MDGETTHAAGVLPIARTSGRVLLNQRSYEVSKPGTWALWGGMAEAGETPIETVKREFHEEASFSGPIQLEFLDFHRDGSFYYHAYLGVVRDEFKPEIDWESNSYLWINFDDIFLLSEDLHPGLKRLIHEHEQVIGRLTSACKTGGGSDVE